MVNYREIVDTYLEIAASYERCAELTNENESKKEAKRKKEYLECAKKWRDKTSFWLASLEKQKAKEAAMEVA